MTRKFLTLFLATIALVVSAQATTPATTNAPMAVATTSLPTDSADTEEDEGLFWWGAGANLTTNYLWRGYDQSYYGNVFDPAIQPSVTLGLGAFYIDLWYNFSSLSTYQENSSYPLHQNLEWQHVPYCLKYRKANDKYRESLLTHSYHLSQLLRQELTFVLSN